MFIFEWHKIKEEVEENNTAISGTSTIALSFGGMAKTQTSLKVSFKESSAHSVSLRLYKYLHSASYHFEVL